MTIYKTIVSIVSSGVKCAMLLLVFAPRLETSVVDQHALQRGARFYMNYCSGCHALRYMRYNQLAAGLGLMTFDGQVDEPLLVNNLIFTHATPHDPITISMPATDARQWFGKAPPDLSLVTRSRGPDWVYAYLTSFYEDFNRPFHTNNLTFPDVAMPDVLAPLRGRVIQQQGELILIEPGKMTLRELDQHLHDLVTFLTYVGEPMRHERQTMGIWVELFLGLLWVPLVLLYRLYKKRSKL